MPDTPQIHGHCDERFAPVREAFEKNFAQGLEVGASFSAVVNGECVVDLWGGDRDANGNPWEEDTIVNVYSTTKAMAAVATLVLVDRGDLDLDAPVASLWPEFGAAGKEGVLVRHVLSHTSGVAGWDQKITTEDLYDWDACTGRLASQAPWWEPGTASGYHTLTHGYLLGEIVRRVTGRTLGSFFRDEVAGPLDADFHIGLPEVHEDRVGDLISPPEGPLGDGTASPDSIPFRSLTNPPMRGDGANCRAWRAAEIPAANGTGNARAVARVAGAVAASQVLREETIAKVVEPQSDGEDLVLGVPLRFGLGFGLSSQALPIGPNPRTFFWGGWGGSLVVFDPDARLGFSYVMNKMGATTLGDQRGFMPAFAVYQSLAALG